MTVLFHPGTVFAQIEIGWMTRDYYLKRVGHHVLAVIEGIFDDEKRLISAASRFLLARKVVAE